MTDDDFLDDDDAPGVSEEAIAPWVMMIVDDEPDIHSVTKLALSGVTYLGRGLEFISCHAGDEAMRILADRGDVAVILLDVVMESEHAGLDCVRGIREELGNADVQIVLRTGQPGAAPEREVILGYDINDYKAKTELTADKLFTTVIAALRAYSDLKELNQYRQDALGALNDQLGLVTALVDLVPDPLVHMDPLGLITACNAAFADLAGTAPHDIVGEIASDVLPEALSAVLIPPEGGRSTQTIELPLTEGQTQTFSVTVVSHHVPDAVAYDLISLVKPVDGG